MRKEDRQFSTLPYDLAKQDEWMRWRKEIPYIQWPTGWKVKAVPPFGGAIIRYNVQTEHTKADECVSIYLDCYDRIGHYGKPYWEVYPHDGDVGRCDMADVESLLEMISESHLPSLTPAD